jgi:hypothetical protein
MSDFAGFGKAVPRQAVSRSKVTESLLKTEKGTAKAIFRGAFKRLTPASGACAKEEGLPIVGPFEVKLR